MTILWGLLFLVLIFIEFVTINLVTLWFACGALISLFVSIYVDSVIVQTLVFIIVSLLSLVLTKPIVNKLKIKKVIPTNSDRYIGQSGEVIKKITPKEKGEVKVMGTVWAAISNETLEVGEDILVEKIDGVKLIVKKEDK